MQLFKAARTQLIFSFGGVAGFNYLAFEWVANKLGITIDTKMFYKLQVIESAYVAECNKTET